MKLKITFVLVFCIGLSLNASAKEFATVGFLTHKVFNPERNESITVDIWYPTAVDSTEFTVGKNKVFLGTKASLGAPISDGKYPVVLLAHGGMRAAPVHSGWVASGLAKRGLIVIVPKPPQFSNISPDVASNELWLRPADLSYSLASVEKMEALSRSIEKDRVYGVGFFLGGTSMLSLAGAKFDASLYKQSCEQENINVDCGWLRKNQINLGSISAAKISRLNKNSQIKAVVSINPELTKTLDEASLKQVNIPVKVIDLRNSQSDNLALSLAGSLKAIPDLTRFHVAGSNIFSAFGLCTQQGSMILSMEGDENICKEPSKQSRKDIHNLLIEEIADFISH